MAPHTTPCNTPTNFEAKRRPLPASRSPPRGTGRPFTANAAWPPPASAFATVRRSIPSPTPPVAPAPTPRGALSTPVASPAKRRQLQTPNAAEWLDILVNVGFDASWASPGKACSGSGRSRGGNGAMRWRLLSAREMAGRRTLYVAQRSGFEDWLRRQQSGGTANDRAAADVPDEGSRPPRSSLVPELPPLQPRSNGPGSLRQPRADAGLSASGRLLGGQSPDEPACVQDLGEVERIFREFDVDRSGSVAPMEFLPMLARLLRRPAAEIDRAELWSHWDDIDVDGNGSIMLDEFKAWYCRTFGVASNPDFSDYFTSPDVLGDRQKQLRRVAKEHDIDIVEAERLYDEFRRLDTDNSGELEYKEFRQLMLARLRSGVGGVQSKGPVPSERSLLRLWQDADRDASGSISFEEFLIWYRMAFMGESSPMEHYYHMLGTGLRHGASG
eukprot:TRINITY_DN19590_c0_g1_i1.p1 TRINITY_DN19590_c0_g1~~TRINITY_DN19590_c0_g1_i1.p1  ORF type:complete len:472 (+),score=96.36 TRINITY_DN19590_c0_g1_i1:89-1417(+)